MTTALASPGRSAELVMAVFLVNYLAVSVPALAAGQATVKFGLQSTELAYCVAVAVLIAVAAGVVLVRVDELVQVPRPTPEFLPPGPCTCPPCLSALEEALVQRRQTLTGPVASGTR